MGVWEKEAGDGDRGQGPDRDQRGHRQAWGAASGPRLSQRGLRISYPKDGPTQCVRGGCGKQGLCGESGLPPVAPPVTAARTRGSCGRVVLNGEERGVDAGVRMRV